MSCISRRRFIATTAVTTTTLLSRPALAKARERISVGQIGTKHAHAAGQMSTVRSLADHFEVVGVVEPDAAQRARVQASEPYKDVPFITEDQLLGIKGLQVVAVETEVSELVSAAQRCADAGMHVFLDKPAGESLNAFRAVLEQIDRHQKCLQMGYMLRYNPAFEFLFDAVRQGWLGEVFSVHGEISKIISPDRRRSMQRYRGGAMFELGCHLIDPIVTILGKPARVTPHILHTRPDQDRLADNMVVVFDFDNANAVVRSALNEVGGTHRRQFVVMGSEGTLEIRPLESNQISLELTKDCGRYERGRHTIRLPGRTRYEGLWLALAKAVRGESRLQWDSAHNLATHETILKASGLPVA
jgi:predicted dehydrogenase